MSAQAIHSLAPLGAIVSYGDGTRRPAERHANKLRAWKHRNGGGRLVEKSPERVRPGYTAPASFALHEATYRADGIVMMEVTRVHDVGSTLDFQVVSVPPAGAVLCLSTWESVTTLKHLAPDRAAAARWRNGWSGVRLEEVQADGSLLDVTDALALAA